MTEYIPYQAAHMVFGKPDKGIATGQLFMPDGSEQEIYIDNNDGTFTVFTYRDVTLGSGGSVAAALEATGARNYDVATWDVAYDRQFSEVVEEDTWDPDYLREVAEEEGLMTSELDAIITAYEEHCC